MTLSLTRKYIHTTPVRGYLLTDNGMLCDQLISFNNKELLNNDLWLSFVRTVDLIGERITDILVAALKIQVRQSFDPIQYHIAKLEEESIKVESKTVIN